MSQFRVPLVRLYRTILKQHNKKLPYEMKKLGDDYVRSEFKSISKAKKEEQVKMFVLLSCRLPKLFNLNIAKLLFHSDLV